MTQRSQQRGFGAHAGELVLICFLLAIGVGQGAPAPTEEKEAAIQWRSSVSRQGNRTRIENIGGFVWPGTGRLVEELSIGGEIGDEPYLFGRITDLAAWDERIYVLDAGVGLVRSYSLEGQHLLDIGRGGPGPGEYNRPWAVDVDGRGRVYVLSRGEIEVFTPEGAPLATWILENPRISNRGPVSFMVDTSGTAYVTEMIATERERPWVLEFALVTYANGERGVSRPLEEIVPSEAFAVLWTDPRSYVYWPVPFVPKTVTAISRAGTLVVGYPNEYSFEYRQGDGTVVEVIKFWDPVPVGHNEVEWHIAELEASRPAGEAWTVPEDLPRTKPAYTRIVVDTLERAWIFRHGEGEPFECDSRSGQVPCWRHTYLLDVFDARGRFLGDVALPSEFAHQPDPFSPLPDIRGDIVTAAIEDENGVVRIKRYRLEIPGSAAHGPREE